MADEPENLTLVMLREIRAEMREGFTKAFDDLAELQHEVAAMRVDQGRANELLEQIAETQRNYGGRLNVIDGRLAIIEKRVGLVEA